MDAFYNVEQDTATQGNTTIDSSLQQTQHAHVANQSRRENILSNPAQPMLKTSHCYTQSVTKAVPT